MITKYGYGCKIIEVIEGPFYADRIDGELTFRDWDHWKEADKAEWSDEYEMHCTRLRMWADMDAGTFSLDDIT